MLPECDSLLDLTSCRRHKLANMTNDVVRPIWFCQKSAFVGELCPLRAGRAEVISSAIFGQCLAV